MDPPVQPPRRRSALTQMNTADLPHKCTPEGSPSPFTPNPKPRPIVETRRPRSSQTVSIGWEDSADGVSQSTSRLQIEMAECVETKTVTTTTTTKRSYPPLLVRRQPLSSLDLKEYPLALNPTPPELSKFRYEIDGTLVSFRGNDGASHPLNHPHIETIKQEKPIRQENIPLGPTRNYREDAAYYREDSYSTPDLENPQLQLAEYDVRRRRVNHGRRRPDKRLTSPASISRKSFRSQSSRHSGLGMHMADNTPFPNSNDVSDFEPSALERAREVAPIVAATNYTPQSGLSQSGSINDLASPSSAHTPNQEPSTSLVATPPVNEEPETFATVSEAFDHNSAQRQIHIPAVHNASLPSPGLSPIATSSFDDDPNADSFTDSGTHSSDSQDTMDNGFGLVSKPLEAFQRKSGDEYALKRSHSSSAMDASSMLETFDSMPNEMKTFMMYQLLRRCSRKTLHVIADVVNPALKCDFLDQLPTELSLNILSYLDYKDLCRAAQVSRQWRNVIDSNETGWKELLDIDGFTLPVGELERAINQGWGWQDPHGPDGYEKDLSVQHGPSSSEGDLTILGSSKIETDSVRKVRASTKRKRVSGGLGSDRAKRRAVGHELADKASGLVAKYPHTARYHKSEGPLTAANAAILAVPDPQLGLPSLRKLHLFKSLYRRHYMLRRNWTSGKVQPQHFAFPAHPSHVITCLQFDDDKILTGSDDTLIHVYDTKTGVLRKKLAGHEGGVWALQYEGNVLVSGSTDRSVRVWDIEKGLCTQVFHGHTSTVRCLQILMPQPTGTFEAGKAVMVPEKPLIITGSRDSQLRVWKLPEQGSKRYIQTGPAANDADCPYFVRVLTGHSHSVRAIAAHQDTLVSGSYDNSVRVWRISTGETVHRLIGHSAKVYSVVLDHKRNRCISGSMDTYVKIWSLDTGVCLYTLEGHSSLVGLLDLHDERLVSAAADSTLRIWDPESGQCKSTLTAHTGAITCFQHDGQKVISGSDRTLKMWNVKTGECITDLLTDLSGVWQVKFDERRCVAAVQRDSLTYVEVLDFGASRDGIPADKRGHRTLLLRPDFPGFVEEEDDT